jgi:ribonuclease G
MSKDENFAQEEKREQAPKEAASSAPRQGSGNSGGNEGGRGRSEHRRRWRGPREDRAKRSSESEGREVSVRPSGPAKPVKREILANVGFEETRIAVVEDGRLAELHWERTSEANIVGNIYKGNIENVLPGISAAFINIGFEKNAYLYISDVIGEKGAAIDATLKKDQQVMIQVAKAAISTKGMKVTMDVTLPGRYLVLTPFQSAVGVSKQIEDEAERRRLSEIMDKIAPSILEGKGVIARTEAEGASEAELERELKYLMESWKAIEKKFQTEKSPALLHKDLDLTLQVTRDILSEEVYVYLIDDKSAYQKVLEFLEGISPALKERVRLHEAKTPIFKAYNLEKEIESIRQIKVSLPSGGSIVIQEAESLCAIDVNTGRFTGSKSQEETVTQTNVEAAHEVAHQLRLRNIGGIIVVDFIDMRKASNRNRVMEVFAKACRSDRAKIRILPITRLGLIEMTRERKRESTVSLITEECPECKGAGRVISSESLRLRIQREIVEMTGGRPGGQVRLVLHPKLSEIFRGLQSVIEKNVQRSVRVQADNNMLWEDYKIVLE